MINPTDLCIPQTATLRDAMTQIDENKQGIAFVVDAKNCLIGTLSDGDIRRSLLEDAQLDRDLSGCMNTDFVWASTHTPRENILKMLDQKIRIVPIVNDTMQLVDIVTPNIMPLQTEQNVISRARAPVRISFGGGGSDLTHFFTTHPGAVINATVSLYSNATLHPRYDSKRIRIFSQDIGETLDAPTLKDALEVPGNFGLFQSLLQAIQPTFGFDLHVHSDFARGSGLGGSSVVSAAVLGCFNELRQDKWTRHDMAELAFQAERLHMGVSGGWQDQYATVFGGVNFMEFKPDQNIVHPLRIPRETLLEMEQLLVLCDTCELHDGGAIHSDQKTTMKSEDVSIQVQKNVELCYRMRDNLLRGRLENFGRDLHNAWQLKRGFGTKITNPELDSIYDFARQNGAEGGKLLGAGGGGFFLFFTSPFKRHGLVSALNSRGLSTRNFQFDQEGLQSWTVRNTHAELSE